MFSQSSNRILDIMTYSVLLMVAVALPLFIDRNLLNYYIIPKQYVFIGLVSVAFLLYAAGVVLSKRFEFRRSVVDLPFLIFLFVALVSGVFSTNIYDSFLGRSEFFIFNFLFLFFLVLYYFLNINQIRTVERWRGMTDVIVAVGGLTALVFIMKAVFKLDLVGMIAPGAWNTVDKLNSQLGLWLIVILLLSAGQLLRKEIRTGRLLFYLFAGLLSFVSLILLSFQMLWWILLVGFALLLLVAISFASEVRMGWVSALFTGLVITVVFIVFGSPKFLQSAVPTEVALGMSPSWAITYNSAFSDVKSFMLGSGLGTFGYDFSKFRPTDFNYDSAAWSLRFSQPFSTLISLLVEGGVVLLLTFIFLFVLMLGHIGQAWYRKARAGRITVGPFGGDEIGLEVLLMAVAWIVLTGGMAVFFYGPTLWWFWVALLSLVVVGLSFLNDHVVKLVSWEVEDTPQYNLSFSFTLIVVIAAVVMVGVWGVKLYYAETVYAKAMQTTDSKVAEAKINEALAQRGHSDIYNAALAQIYLLEASNISKEPKPDMQMVSTLVAKAVNAAKVATDISPSSVGIWENLSTMYENAALLVPEARDWALKSLTRAKDLEPTNPVLWWRLGNTYSLSGKWDEAIKNYQEAIRLKQDYIGSYVGLANAYEQKQEMDKAVEAYKTIMPVALQNPDALFNYGRLIYNRNQGADRADAEKLWLEAIRIQPNYSNALYSLGLLYEYRGEKTKALDYYYKVRDLNPDNKDILVKIRSLVGGAAQ